MIGLAKDLAAEGVVDRGVAERCLIDDALSDFLDFSKVRVVHYCFLSLHMAGKDRYGKTAALWSLILDCAMANMHGVVFL